MRTDQNVLTWRNCPQFKMYSGPRTHTQIHTHCSSNPSSVMNVPPLVPAKKGPQGFRSSQCTSRTEGNYLGLPDSYFIDGKSDGKESRPLLALHPSTFLHQSHDQSARPLPVLWVVVLLIQLQPILRVGPERVCKTQGRALETRASHQDIQSRIRHEESTSHLGNSCNRQQSCLSPSGPG